jgi:hypothetical protein
LYGVRLVIVNVKGTDIFLKLTNEPNDDIVDIVRIFELGDAKQYKYPDVSVYFAVILTNAVIVVLVEETVTDNI